MVGLLSPGATMMAAITIAVAVTIFGAASLMPTAVRQSRRSGLIHIRQVTKVTHP